MHMVSWAAFPRLQAQGASPAGLPLSEGKGILGSRRASARVLHSLERTHSPDAGHEPDVPGKRYPAIRARLKPRARAPDCDPEALLVSPFPHASGLCPPIVLSSSLV